MSAADYARLLPRHPNLVAVKASVSDPALIREYMALPSQLRFYFTERGYVLGRQIGDCGLLISIASVNADRAKEFVAADDATREAMLADLLRVGAALKQACGGRYHIDGAFDKMLYRVTDRSFPLRLLPPYEGASEVDFDVFQAALPETWKQ